VGYQEPQNKDYGVNTYDGCLEKQRIIDRQFEELTRLEQKLSQNQRASKECFFGSSTPSSQILVKYPNNIRLDQKLKGWKFRPKVIHNQERSLKMTALCAL
jgi:hypothetical protein